MTLERIFRYALIAAVVVLVIGIGGGYYSATRQPLGDECPVIDAAPEGTVFEDRMRTEQRLNVSFDLRPAKGGPELSCLSIFGEAKCETTGPAILSGQLGYRGEVTIFSIPEGRTAVVRLNSGRMLCVMPDP